MDTKGLTGRALGEAVLDVVLSYPEKHDQEHAACGTTACLAGWTVALHLGLNAITFDAGLYYDLKVGDTLEYAAELLGVNEERFEMDVFGERDRDEAISNFKHLLDTSGP